MQKDMHFWVIMLLRGLIALLAGCGVLIIPEMARTLLLLPFAVAIAIILLAAYGILDSAFVLISSFMTESRLARSALLIQGSIGLAVGTLLLSVVFDRVKLEWFLLLAAIQAFSVGLGEMLVAKHSISHATGVWNYTASGVAFGSGVIYLVLLLYFAPDLTPGEISWFVYSYLLAFGVAECMTAARMLYADRRVTRRDHQEPGVGVER